MKYLFAIFITTTTIKQRHTTLKKLLFSLVISLLAVSEAFAQNVQIDFGPKSPLRKLYMAQMAIDNLYVDTVNINKVVEDGIRGMLSQLDPHSSYSTAKETQELNEPLQGNFDGIGVQFNIVEDTLLIIQTVHGGPSEKVGVLAGDRIIAVNDTAIAGVKMSRTDIMKRLRGPKGTKVDITVKRNGEKNPLHFLITRDKIPVNSLDAAYLIEPGVGYVRIGNFGATTYREVKEAVDSLKKATEDIYKKAGNKAEKKPFSLMLDLQDNGGGYLSAAVELANEFLQKGDLIVYTEGRSVPRYEHRAQGNGTMKDGKLVILVNEYTASAAEIVSGAMQDHDRGIIVGRRTFGKGLVQRPIDMPDGSMIRLTVAHYYTPTGRCIQKPYKPGDKKDYDMDFEQRLKHGELTCRDSIHFADSLKYETLHEHRTVYGGGAIMPDVFVPLDTLQYTKYHRSLVAKSIVVTQTLRYFDKSRKQLKKFKTLSDFKENFIVPKELTDAIVEEGKKQKIEPKDEDEMKTTMPYLSLQLKALIARDLFDESAYFEVINPSNHTYMEGLKEILK